ncbi:Bax inhibitor-1/YccA family protein [Demequina gelatinilytica]|uniref:Bax inhibitor-1/YccA family protein n=1 Tax=Demequina gelatinilytica TaxID=1638980 RepID=UPI0009E20FCD|nr:Bax inhibitor-1/YccA family protein [Demequina gelatinilytica]
MASPVFSNAKEFKADPLLAQPTAQDLKQQFQAPSAAPGYVTTERMSYQGVINKSVVLGALTIATGAAGYVVAGQSATAYMLALGAGLVAFVVGLIATFQRNGANPVLVGIYAIAEGFFLGAITVAIETSFDAPGAGLQALVATAITFMVCMWLYRSGKVRYTSKLRKVLMIGMISYLIFSLVNVGYMIFADGATGFGFYSMEIAGTNLPWGALIGAFAILLGCISLIGDFDFIENGVKRGAPAKLEWTAAFGLIVTLVWLYIEFLRLIAIFSGRD